MKETKVGLSWASLSFSLGAPFLCFCHFLVPLAPHSQKYSLRYFTVSKYRLSLWLSLPYETEEPLMPPSPGFRLLKKTLLYLLCAISLNKSQENMSLFTNPICLHCTKSISLFKIARLASSYQVNEFGNGDFSDGLLHAAQSLQRGAKAAGQVIAWDCNKVVFATVQMKHQDVLYFIFSRVEQCDRVFTDIHLQIDLQGLIYSRQ